MYVVVMVFTGKGSNGCSANGNVTGVNVIKLSNLNRMLCCQAAVLVCSPEVGSTALLKYFFPLCRCMG